MPIDDAVPTGGLSAPASAKPGATITLTATGSDDFGIKRVRFADGATTLEHRHAAALHGDGDDPGRTPRAAARAPTPRS